MRYVASVIICFLLVALDQITKWLAVEHLKPIGRKEFVPSLMELRYHINEGAAFGMLQGARWAFVVFTAAVLGAIVYYFVKLPKGGVYTHARAAMVAVSAGALGNCIDRVRQGFVVDFFNFLFIDFAVFNVADIYIVCGAVYLSVLLLFFIKDPKKEPKHGA